MLAYPSFPLSATHSLTVTLYKMLQLSLVECFHITTQQSDFNLIIWKLFQSTSEAYIHAGESDRMM